MPVSLVSKLEIIAGAFVDSFPQAVPESILSTDQLMERRRTERDPELREKLRKLCLYTSDSNLYFLQGKQRTPLWAIVRGSDSPILTYIMAAFKQLKYPKNYHPNPEESKQAIKAKDTVLVSINDLRLSGYDWESLHLEIRTEDGYINTRNGYQKPNREEQKVMKRLGYTPENLAMLHNGFGSYFKIKETRINVPDPIYVQRETKDGPIMRASWLSDFVFNSNFYSRNDNVNDGDCVFGERRTSVPLE